jgi:hypothetical protein
MEEEIKVEAFIVCKQVDRDDSGRWTIVHPTYALSFASFPTPPCEICVYLAIFGVKGCANFKVDIFDARDNRTLIQNGENFSDDDISGACEQRIRLCPVVFPHPGTYLFRLKVDGHLLEVDRRLEVLERLK